MASNKESLIKNKFNGSEEAYRAWMRENALKGRAKSGSPFARDPKFAAEARLKGTGNLRKKRV